MDYASVARSTGPLVTGVLLTVLGAVLLLWGRALAAEFGAAELIGGEAEPTHVFALTLGFLTFFPGLALLVKGLVRLTRNVDLAALAAVQSLAAPAPVRSAPEAGDPASPEAGDPR